MSSQAKKSEIITKSFTIQFNKMLFIGDACSTLSPNVMYLISFSKEIKETNLHDGQITSPYKGDLQKA
jgi:hypothetical protein